eukprot:CAMPEP_0117631118 /NCGR_PEP_ID=MMETSP0802-20121206/3863_1 /TAXON_ID=38833 /ORGANISM="Micromonas sp., Strain CCMP2099" /LENGTH=82 /DNA_ID=CAMNT_0005435443 /DNA_START=23 /DNA_END=271 /DNA_ORIENTATION=-
MSATAAFFAIRAPVRVVVGTPKRAAKCAAAGKESAKAEDFSCPLVCDSGKEATSDGATAKTKCVHPDRPVAKACPDCPRRGK